MFYHKFTISYTLAEKEVSEMFFVSLNDSNTELAITVVTEFYKSRAISDAIIEFDGIDYVEHTITQGNSVLL